MLIQSSVKSGPTISSATSAGQDGAITGPVPAAISQVSNVCRLRVEKAVNPPKNPKARRTLTRPNRAG